MYKFTYYTDPGHGWIKVPRHILIELGIQDRISRYSYQLNYDVYLEEDCDAPLLINALKEKNIDYQIQEVYEEKTSIRNYNSYCC